MRDISSQGDIPDGVGNGRFGVWHALIVSVVGLAILGLFLRLIVLDHRNRFQQTLLEVHRQTADTRERLDSMLAVVTASLEAMCHAAEYDWRNDRASVAVLPAILDGCMRDSADGTYFYNPCITGSDGIPAFSLTGLGSFAGRDADFYREIRMAVGLSPLLESALHTLQNGAWAYYLSARGFELIHPWTVAEINRFTENHYVSPYYQMGTPDYDPKREIFWTDAYLDDYGQGLMVTCGSPVYDGDRFLGVVDVDLTLGFLSAAIVAPEADCPVTLAVANASGLVLAGDKRHGATGSSPRRLEELLPKSLEGRTGGLLAVGTERELIVDGYRIWSMPLKHVPWRLVCIVDAAAQPTLFSDPQSRLVVVGGVLVLLVVLLGLLGSHLLYVRPAAALVVHIAKGAGAVSTPDGRSLIPGWRHWFEVIDETFDRNKRLTERVQAQNRILEERVAERTAELRRQLDLGRTVAEVSSSLIGTEALDSEINTVLQTIGRFSDADRAYLFLLRPGGSLIDNTHEWCTEGCLPRIEQLQGIDPKDELPWFWARIQADEVVHVPRVSGLPEAAAREKAHWQEQGIVSLLVVSTAGPDGLTGFIGFDNTKGTSAWTEDSVELLRITGQTIGRAIRARRAEDERVAADARLHQVQKLESVGILAGGVAHEFNNLLMGIMNYVELCRDEIQPDHPIREWLDEIMTDARRSADLTRQLLAFARKQTIAPRPLDLNDTVSGMLKLLRRLIGEDIDLAWQPGSALWPVRFDPSQVDQLLANLCVNARDAIDGVGKITIETGKVTLDDDYCAAHAEAVPGDYVMLAVSDTGCGMDRQTLDHLFEPFFTTKGVGVGTGLGLATVHGIVKQNGGHVNVYSEPGHGTTFRVYLPRFRDESTTETTDETGTDEASLHGKGTILLVEDEKSVRLTTTIFLKGLGYTVLSAECPAEALALAAEHDGDIDLLITDVVMPGMSGRNLAEKLAVTYPRMRCLYMSGYTANVIAHRGVLEKGVDFLSKPFMRDVLARKVREMLAGLSSS